MVFTPYAFLTRLSWLIAQPHVHLIRYHGVLAPHHAWRSEIVLRKPPRGTLPRLLNALSAPGLKFLSAR
jgi:hypothetical protein